MGVYKTGFTNNNQVEIGGAEDKKSVLFFVFKNKVQILGCKKYIFGYYSKTLKIHQTTKVTKFTYIKKFLKLNLSKKRLNNFYFQQILAGYSKRQTMSLSTK